MKNHYSRVLGTKTVTGLSFRHLGWSLGSTYPLGNLGDVVSPAVPHLMSVSTPVSARGVSIWLVPHHLLSQFSNVTRIAYTCLDSTRSRSKHRSGGKDSTLAHFLK